MRSPRHSTLRTAGGSHGVRFHCASLMDCRCRGSIPRCACMAQWNPATDRVERRQRSRRMPGCDWSTKVNPVTNGAVGHDRMDAGPAGCLHYVKECQRSWMTRSPAMRPCWAVDAGGYRVTTYAVIDAVVKRTNHANRAIRAYAVLLAIQVGLCSLCSVARADVLSDALATMAPNSWKKINLNQFQDAWTPARPARHSRPHLTQTSAPGAARPGITSARTCSSGAVTRASSRRVDEGNEFYIFHAATGLWERGALPSQVTVHERHRSHRRWNHSARPPPARAGTTSSTWRMWIAS